MTDMATRRTPWENLLRANRGTLGLALARSADRFGMTVSYWSDESSIRAWKREAEHLVAQRHGKEKWYSHYTIRVAKVERAYEGPEGRSNL